MSGPRISAGWLADPRLQAAMALLADAGHQALIVGGAVRDGLLGLPVRDVDLATDAPPDRVMALAGAAGVRAVPTGFDHGTVTLVFGGRAIEVTTFRRDVETNGRHARVSFSTDVAEDAARRDFTLNALYADGGGHVIDPLGALLDLRAGHVRFVGRPADRIREDHLRILRYFRFQARFGSQPPDPEAEEACAELAATLKGLSRERIGMETMNLLSLPDPAPTVRRMAELGVLQVILPEAQPHPLFALVAEEQRQDVAPDPLRRIAALLPPDAALAEQVAARLRLSTAQRKRLASAARRDGRPGDARALAYRLGIEEAIDRLLLTGGEIAPLRGWTVPVFPLKGGEIVARGVASGPAVARILRTVEDRWVAEGFPDEGRVRDLLDEVLAE